jgi:hypothetical protein
MRMFSATLGRNIRHSAFEHLQQGLLHAFSRDIARNRGILVLAADLVDLIYINDAGLGSLDISCRVLDKAQNDVLHVLADVASLGQRRCVDYGEWHT